MLCFIGPAARGMCYPLRKKLAATRGEIFMPLLEAVEALVDAFKFNAMVLLDVVAATEWQLFCSVLVACLVGISRDIL